MPGSWFLDTRPRRPRRGTLTLVFAGVLATGAATGAFGGELAALGSASPDSAAHGTGRNALDGPPHGTADAKGAAAGSGQARERAGGADADAVVSRSGDRWSAAYSAREYEGLRQALDGSYVGVGISVRQSRAGGADRGDRTTDHESATDRGHAAGRRTAVEVDRVQPGSPADRAGVRAGDRLRSVDGHPVTGEPVTAVVALLRGSDPQSPTGAAEPGTRVRLHLTRGHTDLHRTLRRERLTTESVRVDRTGDGVTRIRVGAFTRGSGEQVRKAVRERVPADGPVLLDLRGNSGGLVDEAVTAAGAFLDGGLVATYDDDGTERALYAEDDHGAEGGPGDVERRPLVVLVDGGTMSAAEMLTGALQDRGRAVVVGSRTFGKGSVQMPRPQSDGSVAELTVGHYTTPSGSDVEGRGITPDLAVRSRGESLDRARTVLSGLEARS
ncbi:PDZ domain-containing protein [Streptomyces oryzae]|uniref:PDZ domain-containing protein n=1 Tax=Streptomyces oryzae TaxID=1434886 RepID=A0ABS3XKQ6_9ACTN|nr:S41 family peptidase [Streptomyces oryzae]MBO8195666.1 PDZ domain-containing protein [Streptomyces oryzae]